MSRLWVDTDNLTIIDRHVDIFPNPAKDVLAINSYNRVAILTAEIYTLNGQKVLSSKLDHGTNYIRVSELTTGIYFVKIVNPRGELIEMKRFVKL